MQNIFKNPGYRKNNGRLSPFNVYFSFNAIIIFGG